MTHWIRFENDNEIKFGALTNGLVEVYTGDMFNEPQFAGENLQLGDLRLLTPSEPRTIIGLWNNFQVATTRNNWSIPDEPLFIY